MGVRWRRPFCTSISRDPAEAASAPSSEKRSSSPSPSPRICARLGSFFSSSSSSGGGAAGSSPSTPRLHSISTPTFRCRTDTRHPDSPKSSAARRPRTPPSSTRTRASSQPSSPISPSRFAIFKSSLRLSRSSRCGLCAHSVKRAAGDGGAAVFTAECSHAFHLACIAACNTHVCPVCSATWRHSYPLLSSSIVQLHPPPPPPPQTDAGDRERPHLASAEKHRPQQQRSSGEEDLQGGGREGESIKPTAAAAAALKVYNDDEPLLPSNASRGIFNPIPEADVEDDDLLLQGEEEASGGAFQGIFPVDSYPPPSSAHHGHGKAAAGVVEVSVMPEAALVSAGRSHQNYVVAVTVKAPPPTVGAPLLDPSQRSPIDLVTVLDVRMSSAKVHMLKRAMRLLISSLGPADRLSIVAFSNAAAKRLLPLSRMWRQGQRSAHQIVNRLLIVSSQQGTPCSGVGDALRKATKVLEDRRDRNPVATIMLLSDGGRQQQSKADKMEEQQHRRYSRFRGATKGGDTTRFAHLDFPIHASSEVRKQSSVPEEEEEEENPLVKCIFGGLMSVVLQDVHLQFLFPVGEISAVYSCGGGGRAAAALGGGRGGASFLLGDLYAGEERELLVELRVLGGGAGGPPPMSVKCSYRDGSTQELIRCREQHLNLPSLNQYNHNHTRLLRSSSNPNVQRLRNLFVATRAVADSRRLAGLNDFGTAVHLLSSARSLLLHSTISSYKDLVHSLDAEMADLQRRRQQQQQTATSHSPSQRSRWQALVSLTVDDEREALTPTSAWRAAERLAKLAIMRKSLNRISDLHGFENARF